MSFRHVILINIKIYLHIFFYETLLSNLHHRFLMMYLPIIININSLNLSYFEHNNCSYCYQIYKYKETEGTY